MLTTASPFSFLHKILNVSLLSMAGLIALSTSARALEAQIQPQTPYLGDTLSVKAQLQDTRVSASPSVTIENKTYPMFLIAPNDFRALIPTTPLDKPRRIVVQIKGEGQVRNLAVLLKNRSFPVQSIWLPPGKGSDGTDEEFDQVDAFKKLVTPQKFWSGAFLAPNRGPITTGYGMRRYYNGVFAKDYYHRGIDYAGAYGSPVVAPAPGRIALVGRVSQGFQLHGNTIGIDHGQGVASIFLHLSRIDVKVGDFVQAGQVIGAVGATGAATGPHLHWGLYVNGLCVDPLPWRKSGFE
ncbi:MAG: M23 family metallopeptidase [Scytolyngbya sp. HA4215-MV1]|jgi:murein DD-endopeptidase MepM/ murein hydrolase activator NlpD|nr:M23 family metallopeptidase [Scytolyngbya sp. HA4215-MV1]